MYCECEYGDGRLPLLFIVNPAAHSGEGYALWKQAEAVLQERSIPYEVYFSEKRGDVRQLAKRLTNVSEGAERFLIVLGGDGTLNEAIQGMQHFEQVRLGYIQRGNFVDPPLHDAGAAAAALDEIIGLLLIQRDLFFDRGIKFLRHFVALLGIVNDVKAVDAQGIVVLIHRAELLNERFKRIHFVHVLSRDEIEVPGRADLGGLQHPQIAQTDRLDLSAVRADLIKLEQFLRPAAIADGVNIGIEADVIIPKPIVAPVVKDVCQLFILVRPLVERFLDQLAGIDVLGVRIVAAVDRVDMMRTGTFYRDPVFDIARSGAKRIRHGNSLAAGVRDAQILTELRQRLLLHQNIGKREIEEFAQHGGLIAVGCAKDVLKIRNICHVHFLSKPSFVSSSPADNRPRP